MAIISLNSMLQNLFFIDFNERLGWTITAYLSVQCRLVGDR